MFLGPEILLCRMMLGKSLAAECPHIFGAPQKVFMTLFRIPYHTFHIRVFSGLHVLLHKKWPKAPCLAVKVARMFLFGKKCLNLAFLLRKLAIVGLKKSGHPGLGLGSESPPSWPWRWSVRSCLLKGLEHCFLKFPRQH